MDPYGSMAVWEGTANPPSYSQLYPSPTFFWEGTWWIHRDSSLIFWHNLPNGELELLEQKHVWNLPFSTVYTVPPKNQQPIRGMILHVVRSQIQPNPAAESSRIQVPHADYMAGPRNFYAGNCEGMVLSQER